MQASGKDKCVSNRSLRRDSVSNSKTSHLNLMVADSFPATQVLPTYIPDFLGRIQEQFLKKNGTFPNK